MLNLQVHKWLLAARSPVFATMIQPNWNEARNSRLEIKDIPFDVVKYAVDFLYEKDIKSAITEDNAADFLKFADKYDIQYFQVSFVFGIIYRKLLNFYFQETIENLLIEKVNKSNVCKIANVSVKTNAKDLREHCVYFIVKASKKCRPLPFVDNLHGEIKALVYEKFIKPYSVS